MPAVSPEAVARQREKARLVMAVKRQTPEFKVWRERYMAESREKRRAYKEEQRRKAGALPWAVFLEQAKAKAEERKREARLKRIASSKHDAHVLQWNRECEADAARHRYRTDPEFNASEKMRSRLRKKTRLDGAVSAHIASRLKVGKFGKGWQELLGYTPAQLIAHLRRTIPKGMKWGDFMAGRLHIDHITPCAAFNLTTVEEVRACWSLSNLRLIDATENLRKSAKQEFLL